jgi:transcriptional regulator with XRE-family HTH domain
MDIRILIGSEFLRRRNINRRYSLRAFARFLGTDHATLSQILRHRRRLTARSIRSLGRRLGLGDLAIARACIAENMEAIIRVVGSQRFQPSSRWIAMKTFIPMDDVNIAIHELLRDGRLVMTSHRTWKKGELVHGKPGRSVSDDHSAA